MIVDDATVQVISAARPERIHPFTGLSPRNSAAWCAWSRSVAAI
jgi:hypothetical protein